MEQTLTYVHMEVGTQPPGRRRLWNALWRSPYRFVKYYCLELAILDGFPGLIGSFLGLAHEILLYIAVWEADLSTHGTRAGQQDG